MAQQQLRRGSDGTTERFQSRNIQERVDEGAPSALQGVKKGDTINVDLALKDNGPEPARAKGPQ